MISSFEEEYNNRMRVCESRGCLRDLWDRGEGPGALKASAPPPLFLFRESASPNTQMKKGEEENLIIILGFESDHAMLFVLLARELTI